MSERAMPLRSPPSMPDSVRDSVSAVAASNARADGSPRDFLASLNAEQRVAAEHGLGAGHAHHGPLLIIAGAGSGKTNTLAHRVAHLVLNGVDPQRILLLTFSRRAAA